MYNAIANIMASVIGTGAVLSTVVYPPGVVIALSVASLAGMTMIVVNVLTSLRTPGTKS